MSSVPVYTGTWTDWTSEKQYVRTVRSSSALIWTNIIAFALGTLVLGSCWSIIAYLSHSFGDKIDPEINDYGLHRHHRLIWRNVADPLSAVFELFSVGFAWFRTPMTGNQTTKMSRSWIAWRTIRAMLIPLGLFVGFTAASIVAAMIALTGGNVLIKAHATGKCGFAQYQYGSFSNASTSYETLLSFQSRALRDTVAGRAYAQSCYSTDFSSTVSCSFFVKPSLTYSSYQHDKNFGCPFGDGSTPFDTGPCNVSRNSGAYVMYTDLMDSNLDLGINARPEDRVTFQKNTTCSPVNAETHLATSQGLGTSEYNYTYQLYCLGPFGTGDPSAPCGINTYTFLYNPAADEFDIGYQTRAVVYKANTSNVWQALPEFRRPDGDTTLVAIMANSIQYTSQVYDPIFLATSPSSPPAGADLDTVYKPYHLLNVIGCVDQYIICNPQTPTRCTPLSGIQALATNYNDLGLNEHQIATVFRIVDILLNSDTYSNTYATGDTALKAADKALSDISVPLPDDQWITEIRGWFEIGLAKWQAGTVQYVANTAEQDGVGLVKFPEVDGNVHQAFLDQCGSQKIKSSSEFQNLSLVGIIVVAVVGGVLLPVGLTFHPAILPLWRRYVRKYVRRGTPNAMTQHQRNYMADSKYHLYFMAVEDPDRPYEYRMRAECPTFPDNPPLPPPGERLPPASGAPGDRANVYRHTLASNAAANNQANQPAQHQSTAGQVGPNAIHMSNLPPHSNAGSQQALLQGAAPPAGSSSATSSHGAPSTVSNTTSGGGAAAASQAASNISPPAQIPNTTSTAGGSQTQGGQASGGGGGGS